jgi:citrate lyase beta subunit
MSQTAGTTVPMSLPTDRTQTILGRLQQTNAAFASIYPGETGARQPVHTVYGGAHLFKSDSAQKIAAVSLKSLDEYAPNFVTFAKAIGLQGADTLPEGFEAIETLEGQLKANPAMVQKAFPNAWLAYTIYQRVVEKLKREALEDFRIDFEDGYGNRPDAEEDGHAVSAAKEVAKGFAEKTLPPFIGIRIKPFTEELARRSIRTLDIFVTTLLAETKGKLPDNFFITLPKIIDTDQVTACAELLGMLETANNLAPGTLKMELMVETTQSIINHKGESALPLLVAAAGGRVTGAHFGTYDYTAGCNITAAYQTMDHPACDFARHAMQVALAGTGIMLSDGATNVMPIGPHRGDKLTTEQLTENRQIVHRAWRLHYDHCQHSLKHAYYQGWDLHPAQLPTRYAAVFSFFLEGLPAASARLKNFIEKAAQATLVGDVFDDAATGQGLLNFFLRGINCGAITEEEALVTGLTLDELRGRSFVKILNSRRGL